LIQHIESNQDYCNQYDTDKIYNNQSLESLFELVAYMNEKGYIDRDFYNNNCSEKNTNSDVYKQHYKKYGFGLF